MEECGSVDVVVACRHHHIGDLERSSSSSNNQARGEEKQEKRLKQVVVEQTSSSNNQARRGEEQEQEKRVKQVVVEQEEKRERGGGGRGRVRRRKAARGGWRCTCISRERGRACDRRVVSLISCLTTPFRAGDDGRGKRPRRQQQPLASRAVHYYYSYHRHRGRRKRNVNRRKKGTWSAGGCFEVDICSILTAIKLNFALLDHSSIGDRGKRFHQTTEEMSVGVRSEERTTVLNAQVQLLQVPQSEEEPPRHFWTLWKLSS